MFHSSGGEDVSWNFISCVPSIYFASFPHSRPMGPVPYHSRAQKVRESGDRDRPTSREKVGKGEGTELRCRFSSWRKKNRRRRRLSKRKSLSGRAPPPLACVHPGPRSGGGGFIDGGGDSCDLVFAVVKLCGRKRKRNYGDIPIDHPSSSSLSPSVSKGRE